MNKSYGEMILLESFLDRLNYLKLNGSVGGETFGRQRYLNQMIYRLPEWKEVRNKVIIRDKSCDLAHPDYEIFSPPVYIHHINPITIDDIVNKRDCVFDLDNLVMTTFNTHQAIHYGDENLAKLEYGSRYKNDTCPWKG